MRSPRPDEHDDDGWEDHSTPSLPPPNWVRRARSLVLRHWQPTSLPEPRVDPGLANFTALERSAEVFRYAFCRLEYWLSPEGWLREWLRLNLRIGVLLAIPSLLVVPLVTFALGQLSAWSAMLAETTSRMILFPLSALLIVGLVCGLLYIGRTIVYHRPRRHSYYE